MSVTAHRRTRATRRVVAHVAALVAAGLAGTPPAAAEEGLGPIVITAPRVERDLLDTPAAVERVGRARSARAAAASISTSR